MEKRLYELINLIEDKSLGFYSSDELINKVQEIVDENEDNELIENVSDCYKYITEYSDNLHINSVGIKDEVERMLINMWVSIGIDIPNNYEDIVQYCYEDILDTADLDNWHSGDVSIAFRRWIEEQKN